MGLFAGNNQPCLIYHFVHSSSCQFLLFFRQSGEKKVCPLASFLTHLKVLMEILQHYCFTRMASRERNQVKELWFFLAFPAKFKFRESYFISLLEILNMISLNYISFLIYVFYFIYFRVYETFFFTCLLATMGFCSFYQDLGQAIL